MDILPLKHPERFSVGRKSQPAGYRFETRDYELVQLIAIMHGQVRLETGTEARAVTAGQFLLLRRGGAFALACGPGMTYAGVFAIALDADGGPLRGRPLALVSPPEMLYLASMLEHELATPDPRGGTLARNLGLSLLDLGLRAAVAHGGGETGEAVSRLWAERMRQAIENSVFSSTDLRGLFAGWDIGYRQLSRHFREHFGVSPKRYQILCRMEQAGRMLRETSLSVTSIALDLGFPSSQHFASQFARIMRKTPSAYRVG